MNEPPDVVRVLYVDSNVDVAQTVAESLEHEDGRLQVTTVADPDEAMAILADGGTDCVVSRFDLAETDGIEFSRTLGENHPETPFVLFAEDGETAVEAVSEGVTDCVRKGQTGQYVLLANRITNAVERSRARREPKRPDRRYGLPFIERSLDTLQDVFYVLDERGNLRYWNETLTEVSGYDDEEIAGMDPTDFFPAGEHSQITESIREGLETGSSTVRTDVLTAAGERIPYEFAGARLTDGDGETLGVTGIGRDITEQVSREWEIERTRDLLAQTERIADVGGWELDADTLDVYWTENLFELMGFDAEDAPPLENALDVYHEDDRGTVERAIEKALESGDPFDTEVRYRRRDGEVRWLRVQGNPTIEGDEVVRIRGAVQDITEQKQHEQRLQRQNERLEEFASIVSHDLRSPLNVAEGRARLARTDENEEHIDAIEDALDRMNRIIDDMLWLAREGRAIGSTDPVDLETAVRTAWTMAVADSETAELVVADDLRTVEADDDRLGQLLENLFRNSVEHGSTSSRMGSDDSVEHGSTSSRTGSDDSVEHSDEGVTVTVGKLPDGFYVEDDGPGIPENEREAVFDLGYSTTTDGTGFGLGVVERIAEAHDWTVEIVERTGGGARFEITGVTSRRR